MDKHDELAGAVQEVLPRVHILISDGLYREASEQIAAAVRSFMGSPEVVEMARQAIIPMVNDDIADEILSAWTADLARAALSAAIAEDGGGRG